VQTTFTAGGNTLAGTFQPAAASGTAPPGTAALLLSGSGPVDRDSNARQLAIGVMAQVAERLAAAGVATLRYDKRGVGDSTGDYHAAGLYDNVEDARAALAALRARDEVDPDQVLLVGHSEGAVIATELAAGDDRLAGVVLLAGAAASGEQVLREQAAAVADTLPRPAAWLLRLLRKDIATMQEKRLATLRATTEDTVRMQLVKVNARWFREFLDHDPTPSLRAIRVPVLAVAGTKDLQTAPHHTERIGELVAGPVTVELVPDMSHLLRHEPGDPTVRTYKQQAKRPVLPAVLDLVATFCADPVARGVAGCAS
jgi:pimeloyl-ACP methyl ester carboxylesterase